MHFLILLRRALRFIVLTSDFFELLSNLKQIAEHDIEPFFRRDATQIRDRVRHLASGILPVA
ncbi:hypothetical protein [Bradyrhizobium sp. sBnM-33]|uniref:hypothetical protein n=1 Tax=Bradyrhizobium sp. sBnM-33 TaxID=2831780 RepID=UPI001BCEDA06|nr:hypothetical protein [Bradyrhizobium sp. sBnM-33]WOH52626.1 hypothetical protein RX328_11025 [Bradyrhizobium sp. sBnM-33]